MEECYTCGFNDEDYGCTCPFSDKWYACPIENKKPENRQELKEYIEWCHNMKVNGWQKARDINDKRRQR